MLHALLILPLLAAPAPAEGAALLAALDTVAPDRLRADLRFFASDALAGRDTPSPELRIAALFLRARVQRLGFQPGAEDGWFYDFPLHSWEFDTARSHLRASSEAGTLEFAFGSDYYFQLQSHAREASLSAGVVCVGNGTEEELEGVDVRGHWVLVLDRGRLQRRITSSCLEAGALGLIMTPGPEYTRDSYSEKYQKRAEGMLSPGRPTLKEPELDAGDAAPLVMLDREAARRLFALARPFEGDYPPAGHDLGLRLEEERHLLRHTDLVSNVCAFWPGTDPELAREVMIVSAHYDHVGVMRGETYNGADDNASGSMGLLGLADALVAYGPLKRSVLLLWVSGEEKGLWGSQVWTEKPWLPEGCRPVLDINIDMIGRTEKEELYITPSRGHEAFNGVAETAYRISALEGFPELESQDEYWRRSDHMNFNDNLKIPVVFLSTGEHPDYHKPTDTAEKIDYEKMSRVVRLVVRLLDELQEAELAQ
jgi:hypothetical protein